MRSEDLRASSCFRARPTVSPDLKLGATKIGLDSIPAASNHSRNALAGFGLT
jgi:hypothetical protein